MYPIPVHVQFRNMKVASKPKSENRSVEGLQTNHSTREGPCDGSTNGSRIGSLTTGDIEEAKTQLFVSTMASIADYIWWFIHTVISLSYLIIVWFCCSQINEGPLCQQNSWYLDETGPVHLIGASLSELHTSVTSLRTCVCMYVCLLGPTTYRKF